MPQVKIIEKDYTRPAVNPFENYAVLLAGFIDNAKQEAFQNRAAELKDENGTVRFETAADFLATAGYVPADSTEFIYKKGATGPIVTKAYKAAYVKAHKSDFKNKFLYRISPDAFADGLSIGHLKDCVHVYEYVNIDSDGFNTIPESELKSRLLFEFTYDAKGKPIEGTDGAEDEEVKTNKSYASQIAYELLSQGFVIYYKNIGTIDLTSKYHLVDVEELANKKFEELDKQVKDGYFSADSLEANVIDLNIDTNSIINAYNELNDEDLWKPFSDKAEYNFRFILNGLLKNNIVANKNIIKLASANDKTFSDQAAGYGLERRGDAIALCDIDSDCYVGKKGFEIFDAIKAELSEDEADPDNSKNYTDLGKIGKYAAFFAPYVEISDSYAKTDGLVTDTVRLPASAYYLSCFSKAFTTNYPEWFAISGYTRGVSDYTQIMPGAKFGDVLINQLEPRNSLAGIKFAVNVIATIRGEYYLWGNRTAYPLDDTSDSLVASHFLNIRQLCTTIKKDLYIVCRKLTFDPNSDVLWFNFTNAISPTLDKMRANQGIRSYRIIRVETKKRATLKARIRIVPIEACEDFEIEVSLEDSLGDTSVSVSE